VTATETKSRPIIFSAPMVRAILEDKKTQTRRICKPAMEGDGPAASVHPDGSGNGFIAWWPTPRTAHETAKYYPGDEGFHCPLGDVGDRLWVRETFQYTNSKANGPGDCVFRADCAVEVPGIKWKSPYHMLRCFSRINLEITALRVERLDDISQTDAMREGTQGRRSFAGLWDELNGAGAFGRNPWVWVISFRRLAESQA
jgi:hypothetical protein